MHPIVRNVAVAIVLVAASAGSSASGRAESFASEPKFEQAAFDAAQAAGKPILIHVTATWCSVCARQRDVIEGVLREPRFKSFVLLNVDFDTQKSLVRRFGARAQSTFIVFKGKTQQAISSGDTRPRAIEIMLAKAIAHSGS